MVENNVRYIGSLQPAEPYPSRACTIHRLCCRLSETCYQLCDIRYYYQSLYAAELDETQAKRQTIITVLSRELVGRLGRSRLKMTATFRQDFQTYAAVAATSSLPNLGDGRTGI
jgi:hypothetical protein